MAFLPQYYQYYQPTPVYYPYQPNVQYIPCIAIYPLNVNINLAVNVKPLEADTVVLQNKDNKMIAKEKMISQIQKTLKEDYRLQPDQPMKITATEEYIPYVNLMAQEAYKMGSGRVVIDIVDEKLENLRKKYNAPTFEWKSKRDAQLKEKNAIFIDFNKNNNPYNSAKLTQQEVNGVVSTIKVNIPPETQKKLEIDPKEIIDVILNVRKGQPVKITAEREHEPNILKIVEYIYQTKGPVPVEVNYNERKPNNFGRTMLENASEKVLEEVPQYMIDAVQETLDKNAARLYLEGEDPNELEGVDPKRISKNSAAVGKAIKPLRERLTVECPWNIYYAPTTRSAISAYPEYKGDEIKALDKAAEDAVKINRVGKIKEHTQNLQRVADKLNKLINEDGMDTVHFVSLDPKTGTPDGKTDLYVGLSEKSRFKAALDKTPSGQEYVANTPTEEAFATPDKTKTHGVVSATMPLTLNGNIVEGIRMKFENGKVVEVNADKNADVIKEHIKMHECADMLGEVALVAGSPIYDLGRVFNSTLQDENATCHIAIGSGYSSCIEGADEIKDHEEKKKYLNQYNVNESTTHNDFMIGSPNVMVEGITKNGKKITLIKDNRFQI